MVKFKPRFCSRFSFATYFLNTKEVSRGKNYTDRPRKIRSTILKLSQGFNKARRLPLFKTLSYKVFAKVEQKWTIVFGPFEHPVGLRS